METNVNKNETLAQTMGQSVAAVDGATKTQSTPEATANIPATESMACLAVALPEDNYNDLAKWAIQNALKLMDGENGGGFYVKFIVDEGTCYGWLNLIIVYPEGYHKSVTLYKDFLKETDVESSNGVYKVGQGGRAKGYKIVPFWDNDLSVDEYGALRPYETPTMPIPEFVLWKKIQVNYKKILVQNINQTANIQQLITALQDWSAESAQLPGYGFLDETDRCYVETEAFRDIVIDNGWTVAKARTELDLMGLFDKDRSGKGYQKTKRIGSSTKRFYVLRKRKPASESKPQYLEDTEFKVKYATKLERAYSLTKKELIEMTDKYNALAQSIDPNAELEC